MHPSDWHLYSSKPLSLHNSFKPITPPALRRSEADFGSNVESLDRVNELKDVQINIHQRNDSVVFTPLNPHPKSRSTERDSRSSNKNRSVSSGQKTTKKRFTSAVGKPGQARETREAVSKALNATNPVRASPISTPMDYEKFVVEKSAQLEHDRDRDLLLFLRDDISESYSQPQERTAVPTVSPAHLKEAQWLLTLDALKHYSSPHSIIAFNYAKFCGDFKKFDAVQGLSYLKFESDMAMDEEKMLSNGQQPTDVIKEAFWW
uniref:Dedicator of cytokinesis C/D N-terminal domain-containing protein n=1 Tax=Ditylenchus dipsaci TaxID=166011 RepID=A0A915CYC3_9BILA